MGELHLLGLFTWESVRLHHHTFFRDPSLPKFGCSATKFTTKSPSSKLFLSFLCLDIVISDLMASRPQHKTSVGERISLVTFFDFSLYFYKYCFIKTVLSSVQAAGLLLPLHATSLFPYALLPQPSIWSHPETAHIACNCLCADPLQGRVSSWLCQPPSSSMLPTGPIQTSTCPTFYFPASAGDSDTSHGLHLHWTFPPQMP